MFKIHSNNNKDYFVIAPLELAKYNHSHLGEARLMNKTPIEYYQWIADFPSAKLVIYSNFISYHVSEKDAKKIISTLNKNYKKYVSQAEHKA